MATLLLIAGGLPQTTSQPAWRLAKSATTTGPAGRSPHLSCRWLKHVWPLTCSSPPGSTLAKTIEDAWDDREALSPATKGEVRDAVEHALDALDTGHDFALPPRMVEAEFEVIWRQVLSDQAEGGLSPEDEGKSEDQLKAEYRKIAERRVRLGLVLAEIGRKHEVAVSDDELAQAMRAEAMRYRGQEQQVFDQLRQSPNAQATLRAPVYEDKVVDLLFGLAQIKDKPVSKDDLLKDDELPEAYGAASGAKPAKPGKAAKPAKAEKAKPVQAAKPEPATAAKAEPEEVEELDVEF